MNLKTQHLNTKVPSAALGAAYSHLPPASHDQHPGMHQLVVGAARCRSSSSLWGCCSCIGAGRAVCLCRSCRLLLLLSCSLLVLQGSAYFTAGTVPAMERVACKFCGSCAAAKPGAEQQLAPTNAQAAVASKTFGVCLSVLHADTTTSPDQPTGSPARTCSPTWPHS